MQDALKLTIEGMHCEGCVCRVTSALRAVKDVEVGTVEVGSAQLAFDPSKTNAEEIAAALNRIGFSTRIEK